MMTWRRTARPRPKPNSRRRSAPMNMPSCLPSRATTATRRRPPNRTMPATFPPGYATKSSPCPAVDAARAVNAIELATRDVRDHPRYRDALLVNATMINQAPLPQPFPVLELSLYGQTGAVLGVRRFQPEEYLDESIDPAAGMPPERLVFVVLELATPAGEAVSFEFSFL